MKKGIRQKFDVGAVEGAAPVKPYDFCCSKKDLDARLFQRKEKSKQLFPSSESVTDGPGIKIRIQEEQYDRGFAYRPARGQRSAFRIGQRGGARGKYRGGPQLNLRQRRPPVLTSGERALTKPTKPKGERMECTRCRGPIKWYLEDEINAARDKMITERHEKRNAEIQRNIKISKRKEKRRARRIKDVDKDNLTEERTSNDVQDNYKAQQNVL